MDAAASLADAAPGHEDPHGVRRPGVRDDRSPEGVDQLHAADRGARSVGEELRQGELPDPGRDLRHPVPRRRLRRHRGAVAAVRLPPDGLERQEAVHVAILAARLREQMTARVPPSAASRARVFSA